MNFVLGLPRTKRGKDNIFEVVDNFSKIANFVVHRKCDESPHVASLILKCVIKLYVVAQSIVSERDPKFLSHFWRELLGYNWDKIVVLYNYHSKIMVKSKL